MEHREGRWIANDPANVISKTQGKADNHPQHGDETHGNERLEHRGDNILSPHHTAVEERQSWRHHQHKDGSRNQPSHIGSRDHRPVTLKSGLTYKHACDGNQCHRRHQNLPTLLNLHTSHINSCSFVF